MSVPRPPKLEDLSAGSKLYAGLGYSTILPDMDFETYSPAGFLWDAEENKFKTLKGAREKGLKAIGSAKYSEHPDAEVICLAYDLKDGKGKRLWRPIFKKTVPVKRPEDLIAYIEGGGLIEAWNVAFEYWIWNNICVNKYHFPPLHSSQIRCAAAKSRAYALPGSLEPAGNVLNIINKKDKDGRRLINKFSIPRNPTKTNYSTRILPDQEPEEAEKFYRYCIRDIEAESELSSKIPDLSDFEQMFWGYDHLINTRGVKIDIDLINKCISILEQAYVKYNKELQLLTEGEVDAASELPSLKTWLTSKGLKVDTLRADDVENFLEDSLNILSNLPPQVRRALEIRRDLGSASVKKVYSMINRVTKDGRLHDLFIYHSARTGRAAGAGPQPQNLPNSGPELTLCTACKKHFKDFRGCPWCGSVPYHQALEEWNPKAVDDAIEILSAGNLELVEYYFGNAIPLISGCLRSMFIAEDKKDLMCSDYKAIEAVVLAMIAKEQWRIDVFNTHGLIYEMSASKISGVPFEEFEEHKRRLKKHHPLRKLGKVAELASGYQGWTGAWNNFKANEFLSKEEIEKAIRAWRAASPNIVNLWYGLEKAAINAVRNPKVEYNYSCISYICVKDVLYCKLPSGRYLTYHRPILSPSERTPGALSLSFEGWNTNPKNGAIGWIRMQTYGGKLTENVVQAVSRDILAYAIVNLEKNGYPVVLHVHDEIVAEQWLGYKSIEDMERIMSEMPSWAKGWPIKAREGWRAKRYNK